VTGTLLPQQTVVMRCASATRCEVGSRGSLEKATLLHGIGWPEQYVSSLPFARTGCRMWGALRFFTEIAITPLWFWRTMLCLPRCLA
jgi:hypothetical protein